MSHKGLEFLIKARVWFWGTLIGTICSGIGIIADSKIASLIGLIITSAVTMYYAYQCWQSDQWLEFD